MKKNRVIVAGAFEYEIYQEALASGLEQCGADVVRLKLFENRPYDLILAYKNGKALIKEIQNSKPDILFLYRVENLLPFFVKLIKKRFPHLIIMQYHNDDPFRHGWKRYIKSWHYLHYIKYSDITYVYRPVNIDEARSWGANDTKLFMSHYFSKTDLRGLSPADCSHKNGKIVFLGHWEDDGRMDYICECFRRGFNIHIYGPNHWKVLFEKNNLPLSNLHPVVRGKDYIATIHQASIAIAFFSKANRDEYTRRCFEIPMAGTVLLQPSTPITRKIFKDGVDTILYEGVDDMMEKINCALADSEKLAKISYNGYCLMKNGPFSEKARAQMVLDDYEQIIKSR